MDFKQSKKIFLNQALAGLWPKHAWFLQYILVCVCVSAPKVRNNVMAWCGMIWTPYDWLKEVIQFCMAAVVSIVSSCGLIIEACCRNQPTKSKLVLCKPWIHFNSHLKQLYISNKMKHFSCKGGCGIFGCTCIEMFKRRTALGCR